jgi:hypothetical protein
MRKRGGSVGHLVCDNSHMRAQSDRPRRGLMTDTKEVCVQSGTGIARSASGHLIVRVIAKGKPG